MFESIEECQFKKSDYDIDPNRFKKCIEQIEIEKKQQQQQSDILTENEKKHYVTELKVKSDEVDYIKKYKENNYKKIDFMYMNFIFKQQFIYGLNGYILFTFFLLMCLSSIVLIIYMFIITIN